MPTTQINLRLDDELLAALDAARCDVPRNRWIVRLIEREMSKLADAEAAILTTPAEAERSVVSAAENVRRVQRSSAQVKADVRPRPKGDRTI